MDARQRVLACGVAAVFLALSLGGAAGGDSAPFEVADDAAQAAMAAHPLASSVVTCDELPPTSDVVPDLGPALSQVPALFDTCPTAIRPGARSNACTLNFVVTDGTELYIGAAGHCSFVGKRLRVTGVPGEVGTAVLRVFQGGALQGDWAFYRIDPEDRHRVDPTMCRWGGPSAATPLGAVRAPQPGEVVLHYGHGNSWGQFENTRGRAGVNLGDLFAPSTTFTFAGSVSSGDSGSPVRLATGEAAGIAIATIFLGYTPNVVVASRFDLALADLEEHLGKPVWVVEGDALPDLPGL